MNPATLLPNPEEEVTHDHGEILETLTSLRADLTEVPLLDAQDGVRYAGDAIVTNQKVLWDASLPQGTSAPKAELIALTQALNGEQGRR